MDKKVNGYDEQINKIETVVKELKTYLYNAKELERSLQEELIGVIKHKQRVEEMIREGEKEINNLWKTMMVLMPKDKRWRKK